DAFPVEDHAAQNLGFRQIRVTWGYRDELFPWLRKIIRLEIPERFVIHFLQFRFRRCNVSGREGTEHQNCDRRDFPNVHAVRITTVAPPMTSIKFTSQPEPFSGAIISRIAPGSYQPFGGRDYELRFATMRNPSKVR